MSCLVPRFYDAENGACLNCPFADSCDEASTVKVAIKVNGRDEDQWQ